MKRRVYMHEKILDDGRRCSMSSATATTTKRFGTVTRDGQSICRVRFDDAPTKSTAVFKSHLFPADREGK